MSWDDLLAAALVGTARRPPGPGVCSAALDVASLGTAEARLLAAAAVGAARGRAGRRPSPAGRLPPSADDDPRPPPPAAASHVLELLLDGQLPIPGGPAPLVDEWLRGAGRAGCRAPARLVPRLLELATGRPELRPAVAALTGPRGAWLAARWPRASTPPPRLPELRPTIVRAAPRRGPKTRPSPSRLRSRRRGSDGGGPVSRSVVDSAGLSRRIHHRTLGGGSDGVGQIGEAPQ